MVTAVAFVPHARMSFGTVESARWWITNLNAGTVNCPVVVNSHALNSLGDTDRETLPGSVDEALAHYISNCSDKTMAQWGPTAVEEGLRQP